MKYSVNIPLGEGLNFPNTCPFSGEASPSGTVRLKQTKTLMLIPLPGFVYNRYSVTTFRVPAAKKIANLAFALEILVWASLIGGIGICFLLLTSHSNVHNDRIALLCLLGSPFVALAFRIWRSILVRSVQIRPASDDYVEVQFRSENYAREFSELNHLPYSTV